MTVQRSIRELLKGKRSWLVAQGDARELLRRMPEASVHCVVTSPPYWGLRDYGLCPSVWGGDQHCLHHWVEQLTPAANGIINTAMTGPTLSEASATRRPRRSDGCASCGAWRGQFGLEDPSAVHPWPAPARAAAANPAVPPSSKGAPPLHQPPSRRYRSREHIHRLNMIKREGYGRAKLDLLRRRSPG